MKTKNVIEKNMKVCLVGSSGGHLTHLYMLKPFWKDKNRFWVTFDKEDAKSLLEGEKVYPCYFPTNRSIKALIKNTKIAWDVLHKEKPDLIISCGAAVAVPFFYIGKMMGAKLVYIEVFDRIDKPTMTGKMVYPIADKFVVQWEEQKKVYPKAVNLGSIKNGYGNARSSGTRGRNVLNLLLFCLAIRLGRWINAHRKYHQDRIFLPSQTM